jgi:hypothetical protein
MDGSKGDYSLMGTARWQGERREGEREKGETEGERGGAGLQVVVP